jgi:uncharacterized protein YehS (DUF1456 family)
MGSMTGFAEDRRLLHEETRFTAMTVKQLMQRLNKITNKDKLWAFIQTADKYGHRRLSDLARKKLAKLINVEKRGDDQEKAFIPSKPKEATPFIAKKAPEKKVAAEEKPEDPKPYKRSLEF